MANDDPIVLPRRPGASHTHQFFGAGGTNAFSTATKLRGGPTTCNRRSDTAAYWVPALKVRKRIIEPTAQVYYSGGNKRPDLVRAFPPGLRMVAGRADATHPQPSRKATWYCRTPPEGLTGRDRNAIESALFAVAHQNLPTTQPYCDQPDANLAVLVRFPDCWNGRSLDSTNHRRHVAYSAQKPNSRSGSRPRFASCPDSHPVLIPRIVFTAHYPTSGDPNPGKVRLSSGGIHSIHADFMNSWDQSELERLVRDCINLATDCRPR